MHMPVNKCILYKTLCINVGIKLGISCGVLNVLVTCDMPKIDGIAPTIGSVTIAY